MPYGVYWNGNPYIVVQVGHTFYNNHGGWTLAFNENDTVEVVLKSLERHFPDGEFSADDRLGTSPKAGQLYHQNNIEKNMVIPSNALDVSDNAIKAFSTVTPTVVALLLLENAI